MSAPVDLNTALRKGEAYCYDAGAANAAKGIKDARQWCAHAVNALQAFVDAVEDDGAPLPGTKFFAEYTAAKSVIARAGDAK